MSINPPRLSTPWYASMNNVEVPNFEASIQGQLTSRYTLYENNKEAIAPILMFGLERGFITKKQVTAAIGEQSQFAQINAVSQLITEQCWKPFIKSISEIMNTHSNVIRTLIVDAVSDAPAPLDADSLLNVYDAILKNREDMTNLSLSVATSDMCLGDFNTDTFAARLTFSDAYLTEFDLSKLALENRLQNTFYQLINAVIPYQFECSTLEINEHFNSWLTDEIFDEHQATLIGEYIFARNGSYDTDELCNDLELDDEARMAVDDYGVDGVYDIWCMNKLEQEVIKQSYASNQEIQQSLQTLANKSPELKPLQAVFDYLITNIKKKQFPFEIGSDVDVSEQLIYSYGRPEESMVIEEATERYYCQGEEAALNLRFQDEHLEDFFENFAISNCMVSLMMAVLELRH
ncbi:hypothetical protein GCM10009347_26490 [Shewanella algicola]|uniref:Uncharacterized protein n=1 Tax=Shewanella algicola TaxID=640633 RepID=A0A9X2CEL2_9GAMM|nr:hypothetical protein [Shewanella algicola]MCL1106377.1 hypothetical protein [Shewanella algicola]GGP58794.1 hypothetical protein GCM10009347_26490 [Shewanella algicola]